MPATPGSGSSGGDGIDISNASGELDAEANNNNIYEIPAGIGINGQERSGSLLALTLANDTVTMGGAGSHSAVAVAADSSGTGGVCVNPSGNTLTATSGGSGAGLEVDQPGTSGLFQIQSYGGLPTDLSGVQSFLAGQNTLSGPGGAALATLAPGNTTGFTAGACSAPTTSHTT